MGLLSESVRATQTMPLGRALPVEPRASRATAPTRRCSRTGGRSATLPLAFPAERQYRRADLHMSTNTERLELRCFSGADLLAVIEGVEQGEKQIGLPLADGLRDFYVSGEVSPAWLEQLRGSRAADPWVHGFGLVEKRSGKLVGTAGFKGPPDEHGVVEIAYAIVPSCRGRGYATEAAAVLVAWAFADERVRTVRAHTLPEANASTRVLAKCGFARVGEVVDPEDGIIWRWERAKAAA